MTSGGTPVLILKEGSNQSKGKEAQRNNIQAAKLIAEIVKSSVGPRGMDKMLVDSLGDVTITNDGATMLKEIDVQHPAAKMLVEVSKATDNEVGDGTTSAVIFAGALLEKAEELIDKGVHPTVIVEGYNKAARKAVEFLGEFAEKVSPTNKEWLIKIARTSMQTKLVSRRGAGPGGARGSCRGTGVREDRTTYKVDLSNIKVEKKPGGSLKDTKLIMGFVLDKEIAHSGMPRRIENAKIAIVNAAFEIEKTEFDAKLNISDPSMMKKFLDEETHMLKEMVDKVIAIGANVLICQKGLDDIAQHYLAKAGILAVRRVKESDMTNLAKATGARIANNFDDLSVEGPRPRRPGRGAEDRTGQVGLHRRDEEPQGGHHPRERRDPENRRRGGPLPPRCPHGDEGRHREAGDSRRRRRTRGRDGFEDPKVDRQPLRP